MYANKAVTDFTGQQVTGTQPDIIHVHEWQTGALPLFYWDMYQFLSLQV